ncbi:MAG: spermidine/putrescine ABC transporter substrate-binding protein [Candidatus Baltobacteraceae bacterium]|jgi:spermidine/putrescine transport system substrate-binding protein
MTDKQRPNGVVGRGEFIKSTVAAGVGLAAAMGMDAADMTRALAAAPSPSGPLLISNWPYYISPKTVPAFEKSSGVKVRYIEDINDNPSLFGKIAGPLQAGRNPDRDIIVPTDYLAARLVKLGWLEKFSHAEVPNAKNLVPGLAHPDWDPNREYSLPWAMYMTGIAYDIKRTGRPLTSVNDIYDPKFRGHVSMLNQMRDTLALVFLGMGITPEKATYADAQAAVAKMKENVANGQIRQFFGNDYGAALSRGDVWIAFAFSGDVVQLQKDNPNLRFLVPKEGLYHSVDNMVIPIGAAHRAAALAWMNYIYEPAVYAQIAAAVQYIPPVAGTQEYVRKINPKLADNPLIYPSKDVLAKMHNFASLSAEDERKWETLFQDAINK